MLDFPATPTDGQLYPAPNGVTYQWVESPGLWSTIATTGEPALSIGRISTQDFGAGLGGDDDTVALNAFFAAVAAGQPGFIAPVTHNFKSPLTITGHNLDIIGSRRLSALQYTGANTNIDILTVGWESPSNSVGVTLRDFIVSSGTQMTGGAAVRIKRSTNIEVDLDLNGIYGVNQGLLWDGLWIDRSALVNLNKSRIVTQNRQVIVNACTELHCGETFLACSAYSGGVGTPPATACSLLIAGQCGGIYTQALNQMYSRVGMKVDTSIAAVGNIQIFIDSDTVFDSNIEAALMLDDALANFTSKVIYANGWFASSKNGHGVWIKNWNGGDFRSGTGVFIANGQLVVGSGIQIDDASVIMVLGAAVHIGNNYGYGIAASVPITIESMCQPIDNDVSNTIAAGDAYDANVNPRMTLVGKSAAASGNTGHILRITTAEGALTDDTLAFGILDGNYAWIQSVDPGATARTLKLNPVGGLVEFGAKFGYPASSGGTITQGAGSGKATAITLNSLTGAITTDAAALAAGTSVEFTVTNSTVTNADVVIVNIRGGTTNWAGYTINTRSANGAMTITLRNNTAGSLSDALLLQFVVIKGATATT